MIVEGIHVQFCRKRIQRPRDHLGSQVRPRFPRGGRGQVLALGHPDVSHLQVATRLPVGDHCGQAIGQRVRQEIFLGEAVHIVEDRNPGLPWLREVFVGDGRLDLVGQGIASRLLEPPAEARVGRQAEVQRFLRHGIMGLLAPAVESLPEPGQGRHSCVPFDGNRRPQPRKEIHPSRIEALLAIETIEGRVQSAIERNASQARGRQAVPNLRKGLQHGLVRQRRQVLGIARQSVQHMVVPSLGQIGLRLLKDCNPLQHVLAQGAEGVLLVHIIDIDPAP